MNIWKCFKVLVLVSLLAGCGSQPTQPNKTAVRSATESRDPDALMVDAMRRHTQQQDFGAALQLVRAASEKAPDRRDIAWLYSQLCSQANGCQAEATESRLRKL